MRSKQAVALVSGLVLGVTMALGVATVASDDDAGDTFTLVERATTDVVIDVGDEGDSVGDMLGFGNDLYDAENATVVGRDQGQCFRSNPGMAWECTWTNYLEAGSLTVQGPFYDDLRDSELAITGGTGAYAGAEGMMTLHSRDDAGTELDFTFHVSKDGGGEGGSDDS